jgi:hypothetical protein
VVGLLITCCLTWRSVSTHDRNPFWFCGFILLVLGLAAVICWQVSAQPKTSPWLSVRNPPVGPAHHCKQHHQADRAA